MAQQYARETKWPKGQEEWLLAFWLGLSYFQELYNFLGLKIILGPGYGNYYKNYIQPFELGGMVAFLIAILVWIIYAPSASPKLIKIFKWAMFVQSVTCILAVLIVAKWDSAFINIHIPLLQLVRFFWGAFLGLGLGISLSILSRSFSRRKRTTVGAVVVAFGLAGPLFIAGLGSFDFVDTHKWVYAFLPGFVLFFLLYHWKKLDALFDKSLEKEETDESLRRISMDTSLRRHLGSKKFWQSFIWLLISGMNVQFCVNFLLADPSRFLFLEASNEKQKFDLYIYAVYGRYVFFIGGIFLFGWLSRKWRSRKKPFILTGIIGLISMPLYIINLATWEMANEHFYILIFTSGLIGLSNSNWFLTLLQGIEAYGKRLQVVVLLILPTFYRLAAGALMVFDSSTVFYHTTISGITLSLGGIKLDSAQILSLGIIITLLGWLAAFLWEDNFEGSNNLKISDDNVDKNFSVAILDHQTRQIFRQEISGNAWKNEDFSALQEKVADILRKRFHDVFEEWMYSFSLISTNLKDGQLVFGNTHTNNSAYRDLKQVTAEGAKKYQEAADTLILDEQPARSLTRYAIDHGLNGLVLTAGKGLTFLDKKAYDDNDYKYFNLSDMHLPDDDTIAQFWEMEGNAQKKLFESIIEQAELPWGEETSKIQNGLILRALDLWRYPENQYYIYIVTPQSAVKSESQQRLAVLLMTAIKIPVSKLDELAAMLTWLLAQRSLALTMDSEWRKISEEQAHSMKTVLGIMRNDLTALNDYRENEIRFFIRWEALESNIKRLDQINRFTLALARAGDAQTLDEVDDKVKEIFVMKAIPLQDTICEMLTEIGKTLNGMGFSVDGHKDKVKTLISLLLKQVKEDIDTHIKIEAAETGLQIVLNDLLGNMLFYTNSRSPEAHIGLEDVGAAYILRLTNNRKIDENYRQLIEGSKNQSGIAIQQKAGIRMVKRIIGSPLFNQNSDKRWILSVEPTGANIHSTTISLTIFKSHHP